MHKNGNHTFNFFFLLYHSTELAPPAVPSLIKRTETLSELIDSSPLDILDQSSLEDSSWTDSATSSINNINKIVSHN